MDNRGLAGGGTGGGMGTCRPRAQLSSLAAETKLSLFECLAVAKPNYEDVFCLGQHAMIDPGQCVVEATKAPAARQVAMTKASYRP